MTRREKASRNRPALRRAVAVVLALCAFVATPAAFSPHAGANGAPFRIAGLMKFGFDEVAARRMAVDSVIHRGAYVVNDTAYIYDLAALRLIGKVKVGSVSQSFALDEVRHRVFYRPSGSDIPCESNRIFELDLRTLKTRARPVPCYGPQQAGFYVRGMSYSAEHNRLYVVGAASLDQIAAEASGSAAYRESTIIRQLDADTFQPEWDVDVSNQCHTNSNTSTAADPVVGRAPGGVISYCYVGRQGRAVWIPLEGDRPKTDADGNAIVRVSPTIGRSTTPIIDSKTGRLLILEDSPPFGPAVWVYSPSLERFNGVILSGVSLEKDGVFYDYWRGFSEHTGRLYILNRTGLVTADVRATPLPAGVQYPILAGGINDIYTGPISVDATLGRLFFPYPKRGGFVVVEDRLPQAPSLPPDDPDAGTADIEERDGVTGRTHSGSASAFGIHVLLTGGIPRIVNNMDQACTSQSDTINDRDEYGRCPADVLVTPGNREYFVAQSTAEDGSDSGSVAGAALQRSPSSDSATDSDLRAIGRCQADRLPSEAAAALAPHCPNGEGQVLHEIASGSQGTDGRGFPVRGAICVDFGGKPSSDSSDHPAGFARSSCNSTGHTARGAAKAAAFALDDVDEPVRVYAAYTTSSTETSLQPSGVATLATAEVHGLVIAGPSATLEIGSITATATTVAKGRTGSTSTTYETSFSNVRGPGIGCVECDPAQVAASINRLFGAQLRARVPAPNRLASERGYQAIVGKDPGLLASDRAVNDDDTLTVNALDLIFYNDSSPTNRDGSAGRSRLVLSFAGVQAESRYGVFLLPESSDGEFDDGGFDDGEDTDVLGDKIFPPAAGGGSSGGGTVAPTSGPGALFVRGFAFIRTRPGEFGMLFVLWTLFATPVYLSLRRKALARALDR